MFGIHCEWFTLTCWLKKDLLLHEVLLGAYSKKLLINIKKEDAMRLGHIVSGEG